MLVRHKTYQRQNLFLTLFVFALILTCMMARLGYLMIYRADYHGGLAKELHESGLSKLSGGKFSTATAIFWRAMFPCLRSLSYTVRSKSQSG